ncbi:MAG TPA: WD40 repeat domain-containing protein, partial [Gemmataceae bacterium]
IVWDIASGRDLFKPGNSTPALSLTVEEDGAGLHVVTPGTVNRWNLKTNLEEVQPYALGKDITLEALSPDGRSLVERTNRPTQLHLYNRENGKRARLMGLPEQVFASQIAASPVVFSPDSRQLAAGSYDGGVRLWDRDTAALVRVFKPATPAKPVKPPLHLTFAADGRSLAWLDGAARICEIAGGGERLEIPMPGGLSLAYSADARLLACGQTDGKILVCSAVSGKQLAQWEGKQGSVGALAFSRDGRLLASAGENGTILVWAVPEGEDFAATLKAEEAAAFWQALADEDAARANRALARLTAAPAQAVPLLKERFPVAAKLPSAERMARLIAELDDDSFKVRERATRELAEAGSDTADTLRAALANAPSAEKKRRLEELLARLSQGVDLKRLRCLRALEVLERIGTAEAKDALRGFAEEDIGPALREEIRASLRRLDARR